MSNAISTSLAEEKINLDHEATELAIESRDSFTTVVRKSNKKRRQKSQAQKLKYHEPTIESRMNMTLPKKIEALKRSKFFGRLAELVVRKSSTQDSYGIRKIRCLALGRPFENDISLFQLGLLLALKELLGAQEVTAWDPDFVREDYELLEKMGVNIVQNDTECGDNPQDNEIVDKNLIENRSSILYYMPHAPIFLMDRVIGLMGVKYVLGNDVVGYQSRLEEQVELVYPNLKSAVESCLQAVDPDDETKPQEVNKSTGWKRTRIDDSLARDEGWWLSVNDLAVHWR
ncbi:hypothetical protein V1511DRAFT_492029 [Dipodascopsis uninucleata]